MRPSFDRELQRLQDEVLRMGSEVQDHIVKMTYAFVERDLVTAQRMIDADRSINQRRIDIGLDALRLIATQSPMAGDMRMIAVILEAVGELERIHDYVKGIGKISLTIGPEPIPQSLALHLPEGRHFQFGVDRDQPLPDDPRELQRLVADLQLFAVHAQDAALRLFLPASLQPERPALTPRELEALRWTMEGKTAWEVGTILGISERTAVLHVNNAMHKLGCASKHQAVLKALRLGLIS